MRKTAAIGLGFAGLFLTVVAVLVGASSLFFMSTAVVATLIFSYFQAWLSVRKLLISRSAPPSAQQGEPVSIEFFVSTDRQLKMPLVMLEDKLPLRMQATGKTKCLPIAPSMKTIVRAQYSFIPERRGRYRWSGVMVHGMDTMGLSHVTKAYRTEASEMLVLPRQIPFNYELPRAGGFGSFDEGTSLVQSGIDSSGIRGYRAGDPLRHVHWRSTARVGSLQVKEFEGGSVSYAAILFQQDHLSEPDETGIGVLDRMVGNIAFMAQDMVQKGCLSFFPAREDISVVSPKPDRQAEVIEYLAEVSDSNSNPLVESLVAATKRYGTDCTFYVFAESLDLATKDALLKAVRRKIGVNLYWYGLPPRMNVSHQPAPHPKPIGGTQGGPIRRFIDLIKESANPPAVEMAPPLSPQQLECQRNLLEVQDAGISVTYINPGGQSW